MQRRPPKMAHRVLLSSALFALLFIASFTITKPLWYYSATLYCSFVAVGLAGLGSWMVQSYQLQKPKVLTSLIDRLALNGDEMVLDVGCGYGDFLIEAAKGLSTGRACGIDLFEVTEMEATVENVREAKVQSKVEIKQGDMLSLPFADATFDVVLSSFSIHALRGPHERKRALGEIKRVLKPGGRVLILDTQHGKHTQKHLPGSERKVIYTYCPPLELVTYHS